VGGARDEGAEDDPPGGAKRGSGTHTGRAFIDTKPPFGIPATPDSGPPVGAGRGVPDRKGAPLDAWNEEYVRRSTLPPEGEISRWRTESAAMDLGDRWVPARNERRAPGDAFDLVKLAAKTQATVDLSTEMGERFALEDFMGAQRAAEFLLGRNPADPLAQHYARASREKLEALLHARVTKEGTVPVVEARDEEIRWLGLDARAMWLLSRIDGALGCDALLAATGMERLEGLRVLAQLLEAGAIVMRGPREG